MTLAPGVIVEDAAGERKAFRGEPIRMQRMVVTFTLRSDVRWSDGEPLTADDSVYAFELTSDPATPSDKQIVERTKGYRAVDAHRVVWEGVPGFLDRGYALTFWHPLPRHAWQDLSAAELLTAPTSTRRPLGWGPFAVEAWRAGESLTLGRNPFYFRASEGLPRLDEITFRFINDGEQLADALLTGSCDVVTHEASAALSVDELATTAAVEGLTTEENAWELLAFGISPVVDYQRPDFFEDVRVRRGIAQCIDREALGEEAFPEGGRVLHSYLPPEHPAYGPSVTPDEPLARWPYDPEAGKLLLAEAGWYDEDGDGVREAHGVPGVAEGTAYLVTYKTTDNPLRLRTAGLIETQLEACGIGVSLETHPDGNLFAPGPAGDLFGRRFDLAQFSWQITAEPLCELFLSSQVPDEGRWGRPNVSGFIDGGYDDACRSALKRLPGSPDYAANHAVPQRIFSEQLPVVPLFQCQKTTLARAGVTGLAPNPSQWSELWNLEQIDIEE
jgi:peptide/nickel transport system substrate-binding protein